MKALQHRCPGCGRRYDVDRFQFGRTIHCACGRRVGPDVEERSLSPPENPRFACDAMLGRLTRWLRTLGFDAAYDAGIDDATLVREAWAQGRWILTRDRRLPEEWRVSGCLLLESEDPLEQLREVVASFGIEGPRDLFGRCLECNEPLQDVGPDELEAILSRVPEAVRRTRREFSRCPACDRIYWEGSHTRRMRRHVARVFATV